MIDSIWDPEFCHDNPRHLMYQHWVYQDIHPNEKLPRLGNWSAEDLEEFWIR